MKNPQAFPISGYDQRQETNIVREEGMTLRDYYAAKAMQGILSRPQWGFENKEDAAKLTDHLIRGTAIYAYGVADAMLAEREKVQP